MESQMLTDALDTAQKRVENYFFDIRKNLFDYDQVSTAVLGVVGIPFGVQAEDHVMAAPVDQPNTSHETSPKAGKHGRKGS